MMDMESEDSMMEIPEGMFDIHICGLCKAEFHDVELFMQHKKRCPAVAKLIASMQEKKKKQLHQEHQHQQQLTGGLASFQPSLGYVQRQTFQQTQSGSEVSSFPSVTRHSRSQQLQVRVDPVSSQSQQAQQNAALLQHHNSTDSQQLLLEAQPQEMGSGDLTDIQQEFSCPTTEVAEVQFKTDSVVVDFAEMPKGEEVGSMPLQHESGLIHANQFVMQNEPAQTGLESVTSVRGISNLSEMSLSLLPARSDEFAFSDSEIPKSQEQLLNTQVSTFLSQAQRKITRSSSSHPSHRRKTPRAHHTIVVHHSSVRQSERDSLMHTVDETVAEDDMDVQSQQLMFSAPKERAKSLVKQRQGDGDTEREIMDYQFDQNLDKYVLDQNHDLSHPQQAVTTTDGHLTMQQIHERLENPTTAGVGMESQDSDSDLILPVSGAQVFRQTAPVAVTIQDGSMLVPEASGEHVEHPNLERSMIELTEDSVFEQDYRMITERTLHHNITGGAGGAAAAERRRRHTLADTGMSSPSLSTPSPPKRQHRDQQEHLRQQQQLQQLQTRWRHKLSEMAAELAAEQDPDPSLPRDIVEATATLQDLAAEASELAESLPDNLASSHLIATHSGASPSHESTQPASGITVLEPAPDLMVPQPSQLDPGIGGIKSPEVKLPPASLKPPAKKQPSQRNARGHGQLKKLQMAGVHDAKAGDKKPLQLAQLASTTVATASSIKRKVFKCNECSYETTYVKDLHRHHRTHTGERPFICPHCGKNFNRSDKLRVHIRWHTGDKPFKCKLCDYASIDSSSLKKHIRTHTDERPFKCQVCPYASRNSSQLIVHLRTHTGDSPFECKVCHSKFKINSDLKRHMRVHTGEKPYQCDSCDYKCSIKGNLKSHYRINHSPENQLQCVDCQFTSSSQKLLREHMKQHTSGHACPKCQYICSTSSSLKNHLRTHSDEKPFRCDFCSYCAKQRGNVKSHMKKRHADKLRSSRRHGRPKGSGSSKRSSSSEVGRSVVKEEEHRHEGNSNSSRSIRTLCKKSYQCNLCGASFVKDHSLRSHMRHHASDSSMDGVALLPQVQSGQSLSGLSETVYKLSNVQPPAGLYIQLETETQNPSTRGLAPKSGYAILASQDFSSSPSKGHHNQPQKSASSRGLDQIVDAAARLYEEQYNVQTQTSDSQEEEGPSDGTSQHVQIVQVPIEFSTVQYPDGAVMENLMHGDGGQGSESLTVLSQDHIKNDVEDESKPPIYLENIIISDGSQVFSSDGSVSSIVVGSNPAQHASVPSNSYFVTSKSPQVSVSSTSKVVTLISPAASPAKPATASLSAVLGNSPVEPHPQQQPTAPSFVTYLAPASTASTSQELLSPSLQQQPLLTSVGGQQFMLVQQPDTKDIKFVPIPYTLSSLSLSQISPASLPTGIISVAGTAPQTLPTSSSRRSSRSRPRAIKPLVDLMPAPPLPAISSLSQTLQGGGVVSGIVTVAGSTFTTAVSSCNQSLGGLTTVQLTGAVNSSKPQAIAVRQQPTLQYQIQPLMSQAQPHAQQQQQQQVILQPQQQFVVQEQQQTVQLQQTELPINVQVIQRDSFQQQQQQQQQAQPHTIPINIITPVNVQQPALPPQPPPPAAQPTQIQIILPPSSFPTPPAAVNPAVGSSQPQRQIILQVQDPAPPPPLPPPPPPPVVAVQDTPVQAVMQGGQVVSLPPSILQSILEQLQGGAGGVSLSSGDCDGQVMGESPVHVQEVVIHMDPRQLNQALLLKNEDGS